MKRWWLMVAIITALELTLVIAMVVMRPPGVPESIRSQLPMALIAPRGGGAVIDPSTARYDADTKLLIYDLHAFNGRIVVSEQPQPPAFTDEPDAYTELRKGMGEYGQVDSSIGIIYLTRPKELNGRQAAVLSTAGTLVFVRPEFELSNTQWRQLFDSFRVMR